MRPLESRGSPTCSDSTAASCSQSWFSSLLAPSPQTPAVLGPLPHESARKKTHHSRKENRPKTEFLVPFLS